MTIASETTGIFLSHNHADKPFVRELGADLAMFGLRSWIDEAELGVGDSLIQRISEAINRAQYFAVVLSPNSVASRWVSQELEQALNLEISGRRIKVLPLLFKDCDLPEFLRGRVYADFRGPEEYNTEFQKLLRSTVPDVDAWSAFQNAWTAVDAQLKVSARKRGIVPAPNFRATGGRINRATALPAAMQQTAAEIRRIYKVAKRSQEVQQLQIDETIVFVRGCNRFVRELKELMGTETKVAPGSIV